MEKIQSYDTCKNVPFMSQSDLDPKEIALIMYGSIPFETHTLWINYVFLHSAFELCKKNWVL